MQNLWIVFLFWFLSLGCSYKKPQSPVLSQAKPSSQEIPSEISLKLRINESDHGELSLNSRDLNKSESEIKYIGKSLSLPAEVPDDLEFSLTEINNPLIASDGIRAFVSYQDSEVEIPTSQLKITNNSLNSGSNVELSFKAHGFKSIFPPSKSHQARMRVEIRGRREISNFENSKSTNLEFFLLTPPSQVLVNSLTPQEFHEKIKEKRNLFPYSFKELSIDGSRFILLRVIEFVSNESRPIELVVHQRNLGSIQSLTINDQYRVENCRFEIYETSKNREFLGPFEWIPLDANSLEFVKTRVRLRDTFDNALKIKLEPKVHAYLGLYGSSGEIWELFDQGRPQDKISSIKMAPYATLKCKEECQSKIKYCKENGNKGSGCPFDCNRGFDLKLRSHLKYLKFVPNELSLNFEAQYPILQSLESEEGRRIPFLSEFEVLGLWDD